MARDIAALIQGVKDFASEPANYEAGWDVVVECYDDEQMAEVIGLARTINGAIKKFAGTVEVVEEHRQEILAAGGLDRHGNEVTPEPVVEDEPEWVPPVIPIAEAKSVEALYEESQYPYVQHTDLGVVCGQCTKANRDKGDKTIVRHASAAHVRACYDVAREAREEAEREAAVERAAERYFEEGDGGYFEAPDPFEYYAD